MLHPVTALEQVLTLVLLSAFVISAYACMLVEFVLKQNRPWLVIATRVMGSWIAAIGMLVLAITLGRFASG